MSNETNSKTNYPTSSIVVEYARKFNGQATDPQIKTVAEIAAALKKTAGRNNKVSISVAEDGTMTIVVPSSPSASALIDIALAMRDLSFKQFKAYVQEKEANAKTVIIAQQPQVTE